MCKTSVDTLFLCASYVCPEATVPYYRKYLQLMHMHFSFVAFVKFSVAVPFHIRMHFAYNGVVKAKRTYYVRGKNIYAILYLSHKQLISELNQTRRCFRRSSSSTS